MPVVAALFVVAIGFLFVRRLWPVDLLRGTLALRCLLAWGAGAGCVTILFFAGLVLLGEAKAGWIFGSEAALLLALLAANRRRRDATAAPALPGERAQPLAAGLLALAALAACGSFLLATLANPHGVADALTIWNLRAHLLFGSGREWDQAFATELSVTHPDYPLLLPLLVVRSWHWLGDARTAVSGVIAFLFTFAIAGLLWAGLRWLRGATAGCLAAGVLLAFPAFVATGAAQLADLPLAYCFVACLIVLAMHDHGRRQDRGLLLVAGFVLGLAAWTKNEGLLFALVLPVVRAWLLRSRGWRAARDEWLALLLGAAPVLAALLVFKLTLVPRNDLVAQVMAGNAAGRVFDASRWLEIVRALGIASWSLGPFMLAALLAVFCLHRRERLRLPLVVAATMLLAYLATYLCTSRNLSWHLATSLQRLLLHLLPLVVLGVCSGRPRAGS